MTAATAIECKEQEYATFYVGNALLGLDICQVQEINRNLSVTRVPHASPSIRGVINLRGDVVTVLNLRRILNLGPAEDTRQTRNIIVQAGDEKIGLIVDQLSDVVTTSTDCIEAVPTHLGDIDNRFFTGVYKLEHDLLLLLNVEEIIN